MDTNTPQEMSVNKEDSELYKLENELVIGKFPYCPACFKESDVRTMVAIQDCVGVVVGIGSYDENGNDVTETDEDLNNIKTAIIDGIVNDVHDKNIVEIWDSYSEEVKQGILCSFDFEQCGDCDAREECLEQKEKILKIVNPHAYQVDTAVQNFISRF